MNTEIPDTIWMPAGEEPSVYSGTPVEMVEMMAEEMSENPTEALSIREAVDNLLFGLAANKGVLIGLPPDLPEEDLARLFVQSLLKAGVAKPIVASA